MVSTPLVLVNNMSHVLSLLDDHKTDVAYESRRKKTPFLPGVKIIYLIVDTFYGVNATRAGQQYVTPTVVT